MKRIRCVILGIFLIVSSGYAKTTHNVKQQKSIGLPGYKMFYILKDKQGVELGKIYIKELRPGIFRHLRVIKEGEQTDTLYYIDDFKLTNPHGLDLEAGKHKAFYGYKMVADGSTFTVTMVDKLGNVMSDDLDIIWDKKSKMFKIFKT